MPFEEMKIKGAWIHNPMRHKDERGHFEEQFKLSDVESQLGRPFNVKQVNQSVSHRGVIRGIHCSVGLSAEAKYVSCPRGSIIDFVVDLRPESESYGQWDSVELNEENGKSLLISERLGHGFLSLEDTTVVHYLTTNFYDAINAKVVDMRDPGLNLGLQNFKAQYEIEKFTFSSRDESGSSLNDFLIEISGGDAPA